MDVKELRLRFKLSQQDLADRTGIPKGRINAWEQKKGNPKTKDYETLTTFFNSFEKEGSQESPTFGHQEEVNRLKYYLKGKIIGGIGGININVEGAVDMKELDL